jgi:hypothetical protein
MNGTQNVSVPSPVRFVPLTESRRPDDHGQQQQRMNRQLIRRLSIAAIFLVVIVALSHDASVLRNATSKLLPLYEKSIQSNTANMEPPSISQIVTNNHNNDTTVESEMEREDGNNMAINDVSENLSLWNHSPIIIDNHEANHVATNDRSRPTTIVVKLSGEMGNCLSKFATARGLQLWAKDKYDIDTEFVVRHQDASKWVSAKANVQRCFPKFRRYDFTQGNTPEYDQKKKYQRKWLGNQSAMLLIETAHDENDIDETLSTLKSVLSWNNSTFYHDNNNNNNNNNDENNNDNDESRGNITLPYLKADYLAMVDFWIDKYYDEYRTYFKFDRRKCCKLQPEPDESVFVSPWTTPA